MPENFLSRDTFLAAVEENPNMAVLRPTGEGKITKDGQS